MKIAVCISNVPDTTTRIKIDAAGTGIDYAGVQWIINPWDELALTRALELKERYPGFISEVIVVTAGTNHCEPTLRKALAIGADRAARIDAAPADANSTAAMLANYFREFPAEIILTGLESSDYNGSSVGAMLAAQLQEAFIPAVSGLDISDGSLSVDHEWEGVSLKILVAPPAILVVQKGIAIVPRIPSMRGIMAARTKPLQVISPVAIPVKNTVKAYHPIPSKPPCIMIEADQAARLVELLHNEAKVI
jgi:electron transfer flavoprotein beta subunit